MTQDSPLSAARHRTAGGSKVSTLETFLPAWSPIRHLALLLLALLLAGTAGAADSYPFRLENHKQADGYTLEAINDGPAPVSLRVQVDGDNVASDAGWPLDTVIPSYTRSTLARVHAADARLPMHYQERHSWIPGDYSATPDQNYAYRLPFADGDRFVISQADDGPLSTHKGEDLKFAVDFSMPEGTPVVAARDGTVIAVQDGYTAGGQDPALLDKANSVRVLHPDGGVAVYAHLQNGSIAVSPGQPVLAGQVLGRSGNTGYSSGPHLHFAVTEIVLGDDGRFRARTVPLTFRAFKPAATFVPHTYHLAWANYSDPPPADAAAVSPIAPGTPLASRSVSVAAGQAPASGAGEGDLLQALTHGPAGRLGALLLGLLVALWWLQRRRRR